MISMAQCPECHGKAKWESPFYICTVCGLALRRREYERYHDRVKNQLIEAQIDKEEEDFRKKSKRHKEYEDWYLGKKE